MSLSRGFAKGSSYILRGEGGGCRYGCELKNMYETDAGMSIQIYFCIAFFAAYFIWGAKQNMLSLILFERMHEPENIFVKYKKYFRWRLLNRVLRLVKKKKG